MAFDEFLADRIRQVLNEKQVHFNEKKMMGGLCFLVEDKMCLGIDTDKTSGEPRLLARIGEKAYEKALNQKFCKEFDITGRAMKGFIIVESGGIDMQEDLEFWIQLCLDFNPQAKRSKNRIKKDLIAKSVV